MVAAGISDDAAGNFAGRELQNLVRGSAHFECANGLEIFSFEADFFSGPVSRQAGKGGGHQRRSEGNVRDSLCRRANCFQINQSADFSFHVLLNSATLTWFFSGCGHLTNQYRRSARAVRIPMKPKRTARQPKLPRLERVSLPGLERELGRNLQLTWTDKQVVSSVGYTERVDAHSRVWLEATLHRGTGRGGGCT